MGIFNIVQLSKSFPPPVRRKPVHVRACDTRSRRLIVAEKRSTLGIGLCLASAPADLLTGPSRYGDDYSEDKQHCHDGEGKDPLECNDAVKELGDSQGSRENAEVEAHGVVL